MPRLPFRLKLPTNNANASSDKELIAACLNGEKPAWDALIARYTALIYSTGLRSGLPAADAEDVVQDVCVILLQHLGNLRDTTKLSSWLISTTKREAWRLQRKRGAKLASELGEGEWEMDAAQGVHAPEAPSAEQEIIALEEQQIMREALSRLPERCARLLTLLYSEDDPPSYADIAAEISLPVGSIGPTRARCLQNLRKLLAEMEY